MKAIGILLSLMIGGSAMAADGGGTVGSDILEQTNHLCGYTLNAIAPLEKRTKEGLVWTTFKKDMNVSFDSATMTLNLNPFFVIHRSPISSDSSDTIADQKESRKIAKYLRDANEQLELQVRPVDSARLGNIQQDRRNVIEAYDLIHGLGSSATMVVFRDGKIEIDGNIYTKSGSNRVWIATCE